MTPNVYSRCYGISSLYSYTCDILGIKQSGITSRETVLAGQKDSRTKCRRSIHCKAHILTFQNLLSEAEDCKT